MIILPIEKRWFDMIKSGIKTEEYREIKPYYDSRFKKVGSEFLVKLRNGYSTTRPALVCLCNLSKGIGKKEWGAPDSECYILSIKKIVKET